MKEIINIWPYIVLALIGTLGNIVKELARLENIKDNFKFSTWFKKNKYKTLSGFILSIIGIFLLYPNDLTWASAIMVGYMGDSIIKTKISKQLK